MVAAAPHREQRGSVELCSVCQQQGPRERHGAVSGEGQLGVRDRGCTRGQWVWNGMHRAVGMAPVLELKETVLSDTGFGCWVVPCGGRGWTQ